MKNILQDIICVIILTVTKLTERKHAGLTKDNTIELEIVSEFNNLILTQKELIKQTVNASKINFKETTNKFEYSKIGKIRDKSFSIKFNIISTAN